MRPTARAAANTRGWTDAGWVRSAANPQVCWLHGCPPTTALTNGSRYQLIGSAPVDLMTKLTRRANAGSAGPTADQNAGGGGQERHAMSRSLK